MKLYIAIEKRTQNWADFKCHGTSSAYQDLDKLKEVIKNYNPDYEIVEIEIKD